MSAEFWYESPDFHERLPQRRLMEYLRGQFADAIQKEASEVRRGEDAMNGMFIRRVPLDAGHELTRGSRRILLKPPHPNDLPGYHCEVFALRFDEGSRALQDEDYLSGVTHYLLRDFTHGRPGSFWLIDDNGAQIVDTEAADYMAVASPDNFDDPLSLFEVAEKMFSKYSGYNIVASED